MSSLQLPAEGVCAWPGFSFSLPACVQCGVVKAMFVPSIVAAKRFTFQFDVDAS